MRDEIELTHEEKINYMRIATSMVGYGFEEKGLDMLVSLYDLVIENKGDTDLRMVCLVKEEVKSRADTKSKIELLDQASTERKS